MWKEVQQDTVKNDFEQYVYKGWKKQVLHWEQKILREQTSSAPLL